MANEQKSVEHLEVEARDVQPQAPARSAESAGSAESDETRSISEGSLPVRPWGTSRFRTGEQIAGRFLVIRFIARGGMGEVYEVEDRFLQGTRVALKMILPEVAADEGASHRFEQEVLLARKVTHPNLCPIYEIFHCQEPPPPFLFLTMKLLGGETLDARLKQGTRIDRDDAGEIFRQMVSGIGALHRAGVIHRDIKPKNVMLDRSGGRVAVSIMDFGLARMHEAELTQVGAVAGTPGYLAPEIVNGGPPSQAGDIFALGVLLHQVFTGERPKETPSGRSVPAAGLVSADVPASYTAAVREFLSDDPDCRCAAFERMEAAMESRPSGAHMTDTQTTGEVAGARPKLWTRRSFAVASGAAACLAAGGVVWKHERIYDLMHPLPRKRFVALLGWPPAKDASLKPMLMALMESIANELSRAEAFDHDLFVIPHTSAKEIASPAEMNEVRESLGANLVLATSGVPVDHALQVSLQVLDPAAARPLRQTQIRVPLEERMALPERAVRAAAGLLDIRRFEPNDKRSSTGTQSPEALEQFQAAEALMKAPNDAGLEPAIEKYKQSVELDSHYALAHAKLAMAYFRQYILHRNPAALDLAKANCDTALSINPNLIEGHVALASVTDWSGDKTGALREIAKALSVDPSNPTALVYQGQMLMQCNRWGDSEATFERVITLRPNYWLGHEELGVLYNAEGKYSKALAEFRTASLANTKSALPLNNISSVYLQVGKINEAIEFAQKSMAIAPNDAGAASMAAALRLDGKYTESLVFARKAVQMNPDDAANWIELGDCLTASREHRSEIIEAYTRAAKVQEESLKTDPKDGPGWMIFGLAQAKVGDARRASAAVERAEAAFAGDLDSQLIKARTLELVGRRDDALAVVRACFSRGATVFQFQIMPDMDSLRRDPRYEALAKTGDSSRST